METQEIKFDVKKIKPTPKDQWEAIDLMNAAQDNLLDSLFIIKSMLENTHDDFKEIHEKRMNDFIDKFKKIKR